MNHTIYIVDDEPDVCSGLAWLFESAQFNVKSFVNPFSFLATSLLTDNAIVLLDVRMPHINGLQVLRRLIFTHPGLPVIMMSGHADIPAAVRSIKMGAIDFVTKPFDGRKLIERISECLKNFSNCYNEERSKSSNSSDFIHDRILLESNMSRSILLTKRDFYLRLGHAVEFLSQSEKVLLSRLKFSFFDPQSNEEVFPDFFLDIDAAGNFFSNVMWNNFIFTEFSKNEFLFMKCIQNEFEIKDFFVGVESFADDCRRFLKNKFELHLLFSCRLEGVGENLFPDRLVSELLKSPQYVISSVD